MSAIVLHAQPRTTKGTGASRRLRREQAIVPGIIYGQKKSNEMVQLLHKDIIKASESEAFFTQVLQIDIDGSVQDVVLKDMQRHPYKKQILHLDFLRIASDTKITVQMPLRFINAEQCHGVRIEGGTLITVINSVEISCLPKDIPEHIDVDIANVRLNETVHLGDLALPQGIEIPMLRLDGDHDLAVARVTKIDQQESQEDSETEVEPDSTSE